MHCTADILRTSTGVTNDGFVPLSVTASRSVSEHAQQQSSGTNSPNDLMGYMMDILSCQSRKSTSETNEINDGCFNLGELVPELCYWACSLTDLLTVTLNRTQPLCVTPVLVLNVSAVKHLYDICVCFWTQAAEEELCLKTLMVQSTTVSSNLFFLTLWFLYANFICKITCDRSC